MNNKTILIIAAIEIIGIALLSAPIFAQGTYPFNNTDIITVKAIEIGQRDINGADGDILHERIQMNYFLNVTIPDDPYYQHYNYQTWIFFDTESNILQNTNKTIRKAIKDYALLEWNYTMNNNQMNFLAYTRGDQI